MRLGFGLVALVVLSGCAPDKAAQLAAQWGCIPVEGIKAINGDAPPAFVLVGEFTETKEAPGAVAEIACNLAASGKTLFVGVSQYLGGATDAETQMIARLDQLVRQGAPIVVGAIGGEDHPYTVRQKSSAEKAWAANITKMVADAGAERALLFVSRADAIAEPIPPSGERFAGYSPMPVFLDGEVVSLEISTNTIPGAPGPAIRLHRETQGGFHGQLALQSLTRPAVAVVMPDKDDRKRAGFGGGGTTSVFPSSTFSPEEARRLADERLREAQEHLKQMLEEGSVDVTLGHEKLLEALDDELPTFEAE